MDIYPAESRKTFVSATISSQALLYEFHIIMFVFVPCACAYGLIQGLMGGEFGFNIVTVFVTFTYLLLGLLLIAMFYLSRNYFPFRITTDQAGLSYWSILRKVKVRWDQVLSVRVAPGMIGRGYFVLTTQNEKLNIPVLMKERDNPYPKLSLVSNKWIEAGGIEAPITAESCPLFREIQEHIRGRI